MKADNSQSYSIFYEIIPTVLRPNYFLYNSWIVPCFYQANHSKGDRHNCDYAIYHYFCHKCGLWEQKKLNNLEIFNISSAGYICSNCSNYVFSEYAFDENKVKRNFNYRLQYEESDKYYRAYLRSFRPFLDNNNQIEEEEIIVFEVKLCKRTYTIHIESNNKIHLKLLSNREKNTSEKALIDEYILKIKNHLVTTILNTLEYDYINIKGKIRLNKYSNKNRLEILAKYLKHNHIEEFEMLLIKEDIQEFKNLKTYLNYISNCSKAKTVKKILFNRLNQLEHLYDSQSDFIVCHVFSDVNILAKLLDNDTSFLNDVNRENTIKFLNEIQKIYTQKQISNILLNKSSFEYLHDIFKLSNHLYTISPKLITKYFQKTKCNPEYIHNELTRISHLSVYLNNEFMYSKRNKSLEITLGNLTFKLPKNSWELTNWARILNNCMASYTENIINGKSIIYGVFIEGKLTYAVEINKVRIIQAYGKNNRYIGTKDRKLINEWMIKPEIYEFK